MQIIFCLKSLYLQGIQKNFKKKLHFFLQMFVILDFYIKFVL